MVQFTNINASIAEDTQADAHAFQMEYAEEQINEGKYAAHTSRRLTTCHLLPAWEERISSQSRWIGQMARRPGK